MELLTYQLRKKNWKEAQNFKLLNLSDLYWHFCADIVGAISRLIVFKLKNFKMF